MRAKFLLQNVEFMQDSGDAVRIALGQQFEINMVDAPANLTWGTTKDQVLSVTEIVDTVPPVSPPPVRVNALTLGECKVFLLNTSLNSQFNLTIEVYNPSEVVALNPTTSEPRLRP